MTDQATQGSKGTIYFIQQKGPAPDEVIDVIPLIDLTPDGTMAFQAAAQPVIPDSIKISITKAIVKLEGEGNMDAGLYSAMSCNLLTYYRPIEEEFSAMYKGTSEDSIASAHADYVAQAPMLFPVLVKIGTYQGIGKYTERLYLVTYMKQILDTHSEQCHCVLYRPMKNGLIPLPDLDDNNTWVIFDRTQDAYSFGFVDYEHSTGVAVRPVLSFSAVREPNDAVGTDPDAVSRENWSTALVSLLNAAPLAYNGYEAVVTDEISVETSACEEVLLRSQKDLVLVKDFKSGPEIKQELQSASVALQRAQERYQKALKEQDRYTNVLEIMLKLAAVNKRPLTEAEEKRFLDFAKAFSSGNLSEADMCSESKWMDTLILNHESGQSSVVKSEDQPTGQPAIEQGRRLAVPYAYTRQSEEESK